MARKIKQAFDKGDLFSDQCPSRDVLKKVTNKWGGLIILALSNGEVKRFSELRRQIKGISEKMLIQNLRDLEEYGLIERVAYDVIPPYVEYSLTQIGLELSDYVLDLSEWIENNLNRLLKVKSHAI